MLFDLPHILILLFGAIAIAVSIVLVCKFVKTDEKKNLALKYFAVATIAIHLSSLWVDYFSTGSAEADLSMLLPWQPCHLSSWLLCFLALKKNKKDFTFKLFAEITFYLGTIGGFFGVFLNFAYADNPNLADWYVMKGFLSHFALIAGSLYLKFGNFIKIRVNNMLSIFAGFALMFVWGWTVIGLHALFELDLPNAMSLLEDLYPSLPWINPGTIAIAASVILFAFTSLYEYFTLKPEDRWYKKLKSKTKKAG